MKVYAEFVRASEIEVAITFTASLASWRLVQRDLLSTSSPAIDIKAAITRAIVAADARIVPQESE